jgi:hypothetical protein
MQVGEGRAGSGRRAGDEKGEALINDRNVNKGRVSFGFKSPFCNRR